MPSGSSAHASGTDARLSCPRCRATLPRPDGSACCGFWVRRADGFWDTSAPETASGFSPERRNHLESIEGLHFWFAARDRLLLTLLDRLSDRREAVLELGCGSGRVLSALSSRAGTVAGIDLYAASLRAAAACCPEALLLRCDAREVPLEEGRFDIVLALDVLEHVAPLDLLREAFRLLRRGGRLLLSVPAFPLLWSSADEAAGHRCRYHVRQLGEELRQAGFTLRGHTYYQFLLFPAMVLSRRLFAARAMRVERHPPRPVSRALGLLNHLEVTLLSGMRLPFGSSLIAWAERT